MIYKAAKGSILTDGQAQRYGDRIATIVEGNNGTVTSHNVLSDAKRKRSPLHGFFEWDDSEAAYKYRLGQASYLLRSIHIVIKKNGGEESIRAFHNLTVTVPENQESERVYVSVERVLSEEDLRRQVIKQSLIQLESWQARYRQYSDAELAAIYTAIEETKEKI